MNARGVHINCTECDSPVKLKEDIGDYEPPRMMDAYDTGNFDFHLGDLFCQCDWEVIENPSEAWLVTLI